jgi:hypothetical protein
MQSIFTLLRRRSRILSKKEEKKPADAALQFVSSPACRSLSSPDSVDFAEPPASTQVPAAPPSRSTVQDQEQGQAEEEILVAAVVSFLRQRYPIHMKGNVDEPQIPLVDYLQRLVDHINAWMYDEPGFHSTGVRCLVLSLIYWERRWAWAKDPETKNFRSMHREMFAGMCLAIKFTEDYIMATSEFAKAGGVDPEYLDQIEIECLKALDWKCFVTADAFDERLRDLALSGEV